MIMITVTLGKTGIVSQKNAFGALPIQRVSDEYAVMLLKKAYAAGMTFFDTARFYTDSECKLGEALEGIRDKVDIATKTGATKGEIYCKKKYTTMQMQSSVIQLLFFIFSTIRTRLPAVTFFLQTSSLCLPTLNRSLSMVFSKKYYTHISYRFWDVRTPAYMQKVPHSVCPAAYLSLGT